MQEYSANREKSPSNRKTAKIALFWVLAALIAGAGFFIWQTQARFGWIELKSDNPASAFSKTSRSAKNLFGGILNRGDSAKPPVNFLILGAAGPGYEGSDLTDTILIARFDPAAKKLFLFSLPRDLLVSIPGTKDFTKINALYAYAKESEDEFNWIKQKTQEITGLQIDHYVLVNLTAVKELVDIFGGLNIQVKEDIIDTKFPGPNYSYQTFQIKSGWRFMDGETVLKYVRSRHSEGGDFDRIARQQQVIQTLKQKILGLRFWDIGQYLDIYEAISKNIKTDLGVWKIRDYWQDLKDLPGEDIVKNEISRDLVTTGQLNFSGSPASVVIPKMGIEKYDEIREFVEETIE